MESIYEDTLMTLEASKADADDETITGTGVDMQGYDRVAFVVACGAGNNGSLTIKAQQDTASNFGTAADLAGTSTTITTTVGAGQVGVLEIVQPRERYVRAVLTIPNWNAVPVTVVAHRYAAKSVPQANTYGELHVSPAEGTA